MSFIALLAAAALVPEEPPSGVIRREVFIKETQTLEFPEAIDAPLSAYGNCLAASRGLLSPWIKNPPVEVGGDCDPARRQAADEADRLLRGTRGMNARERARLIEANLENVEAFMDRKPIPHPEASRFSSETSEN